MKRLFIIWLLTGQHVFSQEPIHNFGNLKIHENGAVGFHHNLINNGPFDENSGLAGFFNNTNLFISGALTPVFNDMEVLIGENLFLETAIGVKGHLNFVDGTIVSSRNFLDINTAFIDDAFYSGEDDDSKIDGYAMMTNKEAFRFPIGDSERIRPLLFETQGDTISAKSAYFLENPNTPSTFDQSFDTNSVGPNVRSVSTLEFWHLVADTQGRVELLWDDRSDVMKIVENAEQLTVVGWHREDQEWQNLGVMALKGDLEFGRLVSDYFNTNDYSIVTLGSGIIEDKAPLLTNYLLTRNSDGINDLLVIEGVVESPNNILEIFNRWGRSVYLQENYRNDFDGKSNIGLVYRKGQTLPTGIYFYVIELKDLDIVHQGYLYVNE